MTLASLEELFTRSLMDESPALRLLFHRLNNQLGVIVANAELLESKAGDDANRARAAQVVTTALDAMKTARAIQREVSTPSAPSSQTES